MSATVCFEPLPSVQYSISEKMCITTALPEYKFNDKVCTHALSYKKMFHTGNSTVVIIWELKYGTVKYNNILGS